MTRMSQFGIHSTRSAITKTTKAAGVQRNRIKFCWSFGREMTTRRGVYICFFYFIYLSSSLFLSSPAFQSDELLLDDEEFGLEGGRPTPPSDLEYPNPTTTTPTPTHTLHSTTRRRSSSSDDSDSKIQFTLEHAFGDSDFTPAGTFTARLKTWNHGGQTLTKLRFSRNSLTEHDKEDFKKLLDEDEFYRIRLPSNVLSPPGKDYVISSVRARCLPRDSLDEHFVIHMESVNILAVNYGSPGACSYPRSLKLPSKWSFNSYSILKNSEQAPRAPAFAEDILGGGGDSVEGEGIKPPERSFWAKYWMYLIPLVLIIMNAVTQAMNMPEEQAGGQAASQVQQSTAQRAPAVRRR